MDILTTKADLKKWVSIQKKAQKTIGFVPTMGALHDGHISLISSSSKETDVTIVSIFVNPTQFGPAEDFEAYPRTLNSDVEKAKLAGAVAVFAPEKSEIYPQKTYFNYSIDELTNNLCGAKRKGHFEGVCQIVSKLFNLVEPQKAYFGKKDIQQCVILNRMVEEFDIPVELVLKETIREEDGLAKSSRNTYLSDKQRSIAPFIYKTLVRAHSEIVQGKSISKIIDRSKYELREAGFIVDYVEFVDASFLSEKSEVQKGESYILGIAAYLGKTRLIDNLIILT